MAVGQSLSLLPVINSREATLMSDLGLRANHRESLAEVSRLQRVNWPPDGVCENGPAEVVEVQAARRL
jgi:hypothetical protein